MDSGKYIDWYIPPWEIKIVQYQLHILIIRETSDARAGACTILNCDCTSTCRAFTRQNLHSKQPDSSKCFTRWHCCKPKLKRANRYEWLERVNMPQPGKVGTVGEAVGHWPAAESSHCALVLPVSTCLRQIYVVCIMTDQMSISQSKQGRALSPACHVIHSYQLEHILPISLEFWSWVIMHQFCGQILFKTNTN